MAEMTDLQSRVSAEFEASAQWIKNLQKEAVEAYEGRQARLQLFEQVCQQLRDIWQPRLKLLAERFGEQVKVTPNITRELRQATFDVESRLARVQLRFTASTDTDVRKLVLDYNLEIVPILMAFDRHSHLEFPLETVDAAAVGRWIDDRIVDFVRAYLNMSHNEYYLKDHMVVDPVSGTAFPKFAAAATLERNGKTLYFISDKTRQEFESKQ